jgi:hypothetical protein
MPTEFLLKRREYTGECPVRKEDGGEVLPGQPTDGCDRAGEVVLRMERTTA